MILLLSQAMIFDDLIASKGLFRNFPQAERRKFLKIMPII